MHHENTGSHAHSLPEEMGADFWNERYRTKDRVWSGRPNRQLVAEAADLAPGRALDVGSGEGADSVWLAERGWRVTAVDISTVALERAAAHARERGDAVADRITWRQADLTGWAPPEAAFDLVSAQFMHLRPEPMARLVGALAAAVAPGGHLLIVGHHPADVANHVPRPPYPEMFYTAEDLVALLPDTGWSVVVGEARPNSQTLDGRVYEVHDAVLRVRRDPA
ncbi:SAM-dependent methyltransferase [Nocardiopsis aegyptia]|uniref:SAM-dependent methyltransferase n=1 Tax=Nocardiopsis aegyptia TaxID=220378 RepID=A0A7Z0EP07_9ACTN|nr:class I SAM-dependent methyltransferase [Nocardiopsis aegyptia]NYJ35647.1 SAM-dependent methyltransferase [Nocardiopsis aegyptia]